ncbi:CatB-related O-acetyltransferase [Roseomonas gilardii]|uniref:CatB-related O-acetyltransferase n=1 Tax=Roseomonas gilardii TaxID=257708 RepID=UPI0009DF8A6B|nr:CatB-related O-acetyltransferase [Roseomonas gilardii]
MLVSEVGREVQVLATDRIIEFFSDHRIFFSPRKEARRISEKQKISFLKGTKVEPYVGFYAGNNIPTCGALSYSNSPIQSGVQLGRYCSVASGVWFGGRRHPVEALTTSLISYDRSSHLTRTFVSDLGFEKLRIVPTPDKHDPVLLHDVWIGANVMIQRGVTIGTGSIVATGSVVSRDVPPYTIVGGNPARKIRRSLLKLGVRRDHQLQNGIPS